MAEAKRAEFLKQHRQQRDAASLFKRGRMTFADALAAHMEKIESDVQAKRTKPPTLHYWKQIFVAPSQKLARRGVVLNCSEF